MIAKCLLTKRFPIVTTVNECAEVLLIHDSLGLFMLNSLIYINFVYFNFISLPSEASNLAFADYFVRVSTLRDKLLLQVGWVNWAIPSKEIDIIY